MRSTKQALEAIYDYAMAECNADSEMPQCVEKIRSLINQHFDYEDKLPVKVGQTNEPHYQILLRLQARAKSEHLDATIRSLRARPFFNPKDVSLADVFDVLKKENDKIREVKKLPEPECIHVPVKTLLNTLKVVHAKGKDCIHSANPTDCTAKQLNHMYDQFAEAHKELVKAACYDNGISSSAGKVFFGLKDHHDPLTVSAFAAFLNHKVDVTLTVADVYELFAMYTFISTRTGEKCVRTNYRNMRRELEKWHDQATACTHKHSSQERDACFNILLHDIEKYALDDVENTKSCDCPLYTLAMLDLKMLYQLPQSDAHRIMLDFATKPLLQNGYPEFDVYYKEMRKGILSDKRSEWISEENQSIATRVKSFVDDPVHYKQIQDCDAQQPATKDACYMAILAKFRIFFDDIEMELVDVTETKLNGFVAAFLFELRLPLHQSAKNKAKVHDNERWVDGVIDGLKKLYAVILAPVDDS